MFDVNEYKEMLLKSDTIDDCKKVPLPKMDDNQNYIFISYSHLDYKAVYADLAEMYARGVRFWYDKGLCAGKDWDTEVKAKIESVNCVGVIFYMSENLFKSESANKEIQIAYDISLNEQDGVKKNYFGVNLTGKSSAEILMSAISMSDRPMTMEHINTLSAAFSDKATYLDHKSPEHIKDLISQIEMQFGVIDETINDEISLEFDNSSCDTVITFLMGATKEDIITAKELYMFLAEKGYSVYIAEEAETQSEKYNEFTMRQNEIKVKKCKNIICIAPALGVIIYHKEIEKCYKSLDKNIIFYVENTNYITNAGLDTQAIISKDNYKDILPGLLEAK